MKKLSLISVLVLIISFFSFPSTSYCQIKGTWSVGWSIGFISKGGAFIKYYPADGIAVEVFAGGYPHIWHVGSEISIHPFTVATDGYKNLAVTAGYSWFGGSGPISSSSHGLNFGVDLFFTTKKSKFFTEEGWNENFFISIGGTYLLDGRVIEYNEETEERIIKEIPDRFNWRPFIEGGTVYLNGLKEL